MTFSHVSFALYVCFPKPPQATWGKWLAQGLTEGRQIHTALIRKKDYIYGQGLFSGDIHYSNKKIKEW